MACPKCGAPMINTEDQMVCIRGTCGYRREIAKPVPTQGELLKENLELKRRIAELEQKTMIFPSIRT